jgi:hypothetical protein
MDQSGGAATEASSRGGLTEEDKKQLKAVG